MQTVVKAVLMWYTNYTRKCVEVAMKFKNDATLGIFFA